MRYLIVHRAGEIYKLRFEPEEDVWVLHHSAPGLFYTQVGHNSDRVKNWLDERSFNYYWEDQDD